MPRLVPPPLYEDRGYETPCLIWQGHTCRKGYGRIKRAGRLQQCHRFYWEEAYGIIAPGLQLDHLCFQRDCINLEHLEPVTPLENSNRSRRTRLRDQEIVIALELRAQGLTQREVAERFGVHQGTISDLETGRRKRIIT